MTLFKNRRGFRGYENPLQHGRTRRFYNDPNPPPGGEAPPAPGGSGGGAPNPAPPAPPPPPVPPAPPAPPPPAPPAPGGQHALSDAQIGDIKTKAAEKAKQEAAVANDTAAKERGFASYQDMLDRAPQLATAVQQRGTELETARQDKARVEGENLRLTADLQKERDARSIREKALLKGAVEVDYVQQLIETERNALPVEQRATFDVNAAVDRIVTAKPHLFATVRVPATTGPTGGPPAPPPGSTNGAAAGAGQFDARGLDSQKYLEEKRKAGLV